MDVLFLVNNFVAAGASGSVAPGISFKWHDMEYVDI